jgi:putative aldouronate transport system substrate-binding protein
MKRTKAISLLLTCLLIVGMAVSCARTPGAAGTTAPTTSTTPAGTTSPTNEPDAFAEPVHFTMTGLQDITDGVDYTQDIIFKTLSEKFNFTYDLFPLTWDNWAEKNRLWITSGDMPDMTIWNFNYTEYASYAEQGLISAMPEGWEKDYPALSEMVAATGVADKIKIDGKTYALPKAIFMNFAPVTTPVSHLSIIYRKDWVEQLKLAPFGDTITLNQLSELIEKSKTANLGSGKTIGLTAGYSQLVSLFVSLKNKGWDSFYKENGKYVWGPAQPETVEGIKLLKEYYDKGLFDPDFYLNDTKENRNKFASGISAAMFDDGTIDNFGNRIFEFAAANPDKDAFASIGLTTLVGEDGKWHGKAGPNFWCTSVFSPKIGEAKMSRMLALYDYLATKEGQELIRLGVEGVDWERAGDGYKILRPANSDGSYPLLKTVYPSCGLWMTLVILADDFGFADPTADARVIKAVSDMYALREKGDVLAFDPDFTYYTSDAKSNYSVAVADEVVRLIMQDNVDIDKEWAKFVEAQSGMWQPLLNELNAEFGSN